MARHLTTAIRNALLNQFVSDAGSGALIRLYDSTQPAAGGAGTTLLAQLTCSSVLGTVSGGVLTLNAVTQDSSADASGTCTWFRISTSGGTWVMDGSVTATGGGGDLTMPTTTVTAGLPVTMSGTNTITAGDA